MAAQARREFLTDKAKFQLRQVDRHMSLVNATLRARYCGAGCQTALKSDLGNATSIRATLNRTLHPVGNLAGLLRNFNGPASVARVGVGYTPPSGLRGFCVAPQITSLSVNQGLPTDPVVINGSGFGTKGGEIYFTVNPGQAVQAYSEFSYGAPTWTDTQIITSVPDVTGIQQAYAGNVYVVTCAQSNTVPFQFNPAIGFESLPIDSSHAAFGDFSCGADMCGSQPAINSDGSAGDSVWAGMFTGRRGDDQFFGGGYQLNNGWVVLQFGFRSWVVSSGGQVFSPPDSSNGCALAAEPQAYSTSAYADAHCWVSPGGPGNASYTLWISIQGPLGVPYQ